METTGYKPMTQREWWIMLMTSDTRYLPSRCCGRTIYYMYHGDEWCKDHRCSVMCEWGEQCSRRATIADECAQHWNRHLRTITGLSATLKGREKKQEGACGITEDSKNPR